VGRPVGLSHADAHAKLIDPAIHARGWTEDLIRREETAGAIEIIDGRPYKQTKGRVDHTLRINATAEVQALSEAMGSEGAGPFVTLASFSKQVRDSAEAKGKLRPLDGDALLELLSEHYEELDAKYRARIPLKRVCIPEPAAESRE